CEVSIVKFSAKPRMLRAYERREPGAPLLARAERTEARGPGTEARALGGSADAARAAAAREPAPPLQLAAAGAPRRARQAPGRVRRRGTAGLPARDRGGARR